MISREGRNSCIRQLVEAVNQAKERLHGRVPVPHLEIAVGTEVAMRLREEYSHQRRLMMENKIPELMGLRVYVDDCITANWYEIRMTVKKGVVQ